MDKNKKAKEKLVRERTRLLLSRPFFGILALKLEFVPEPEIPSMSVDGINLFYNPDFVLRRSSGVICMLIAHEVLHCALGHIWRQGVREKEKWNYATDYVVNLILAKEGFDVPKDCLCDIEYDGMEAERIYAKLGNERLSTMDSHEKWPGQKSESKDKKEGEKKGDDGSERSGEKQDEPPKKKDSEQKVNAKGIQEEKKLEKRWKESLARAVAAALLRGKLPGSADQFIKDVFEPKLNWRAILRDIIITSAKNDFRLLPPSKKHLWREMYLPSIQGESLVMAMAVDSSASISPEEFQALLAEVRGIAEEFGTFTVYFFLCDAKIHFRTILSEHDEWPNEFQKQNGGTSFVPVFEAIEEENLSPSVLVYLTDGDGEYPSFPPEYPVIWALSKEYEVPFGVSLIVEGEKT